MTTGKTAPLVGIIGFGRFGPLLARLLTPAHQVLVYDLADVSESARAEGARAVSWEELAAAETFFVAVPIRRFKEVVARLSKVVRPGATVIDVCSVKVYPPTVILQRRNWLAC